MKRFWRKIMAMFIQGVELIRAFFKGEEYEGWMNGEKIWPAEAVIVRTDLLLDTLPNGYTGATTREDIPACGAACRRARIYYKQETSGVEHVYSVDVAFSDGAISAASKEYTASGKTLVGLRHATVKVDGESKDVEVEVYQEANVVTRTSKSQPAQSVTSDTWYYYTPDIVSLSYSGSGNRAAGGTLTPSFLVRTKKEQYYYRVTEKTWTEQQSTAKQEVGLAPRVTDVKGGNTELVGTSTPVTTEYTSTSGTGEVVIKFDTEQLKQATLVSASTGVISVYSMGTTSYPNGRTIGYGKIIVTVPRTRDGENSRAEESVKLTQEANIKSLEGSAAIGLYSATMLDQFGRDITSSSDNPLTYAERQLFCKVLMEYRDEYKWTSGVAEYTSAYRSTTAATLSVQGDNPQMLSITGNTVQLPDGNDVYVVTMTKNTNRDAGRSAYISATVPGSTRYTQTIYQSENTEVPQAAYYLKLVKGGETSPWSLVRTNKQLSATKVVYYTFTRVDAAELQTQVSGSVEVDASLPEGTVIVPNLVPSRVKIITGYSDY